MKYLIQRIKNNKATTALAKFKPNIPDVKNLPRDVVLGQFANQMKLRQLEWIEKGSPITIEEMEEGVRRDWALTKIAYLGAGITLNDLLEAGREAIENPETAVPLPKPVQWIVNKTGRNVKCPCGSGKKYKKCCGKGK